MIMTRRRLLASALSAGTAACAAAPPKPLFDGVSFDGWQRAGGGVWTIEDRAFVGRFDRASPGAGYLMTQEQFEDFELTLEFWISKGGNSGVFIREPRRPWSNRGDERPAHGDPSGYEVQINYADPTQPTGMIYGLQLPERSAGGEERWNRMRIACRGAVTEIFVDDVLLNQYRDTKIQPGVSGLQIHGGPPHDHIVKFRNLEIA
jgi:hypothetical protein